jgi:hypothetical protein
VLALMLSVSAVMADEPAKKEMPRARKTAADYVERPASAARNDSNRPSPTWRHRADPKFVAAYRTRLRPPKRDGRRHLANLNERC